jgi:hypothetical protein
MKNAVMYMSAVILLVAGLGERLVPPALGV